MNTLPENTTPDEIESPEIESDDGAQVVEPTGVDEQSPASLKQKLAEAEKLLLLAQADLENFRRRTRRDTQDQIRYAALGLMNELLEVSDNLQRAIEAAESDPASGGLLDGVKMVAQQIFAVLENHGCKKIDAVGQPFDPQVHQAVQMYPSDDVPANSVMQELRTGFELHDRVIRPAQVFVSAGPDNLPAKDNNQESTE